MTLDGKDDGNLWAYNIKVMGATPVHAWGKVGHNSGELHWAAICAEDDTCIVRKTFRECENPSGRRLSECGGRRLSGDAPRPCCDPPFLCRTMEDGKFCLKCDCEPPLIEEAVASFFGGTWCKCACDESLPDHDAYPCRRNCHDSTCTVKGCGFGDLTREYMTNCIKDDCAPHPMGMCESG